MTKVSMVAKMTVKPEKADEFAEVFDEIFAHIDSDEPGTEHYVLHRSTVEPNVFIMTEMYADQAAFEAHAKSDAIVALGPVFGGWLDNFELMLAEPIKAAKGLDIG